MGEGRRPLYKTYSGTAPYGFISYAHADAERVLSVVGALDGDRYRLWYDAGIEAGTNWPEVVASHLLHAGTAVFFLSARFLRSQNCVREVHYAVSQRKPMILVYLEPVELPEDLAMQFSTAKVIHGEDGDGLRIARAVETELGADFLGDGVTGYAAVSVSRRKGNLWHGASILFGTLFLLTVLFVVAYVAGWIPSLGARALTASGTAAGSAEKGDVEITVFRDSVSRDILLRAYEGESLYLCGNYLVSDPSAIRFRGGVWYVGDEQAEAGRDDVLDLAIEKGPLTYLALVNESIGSFDALSALPELLYLDVSGNPVSDLSFLRSLPGLKTLKLIDVPATDYSALGVLDELETVFVSYDALDAVLAALGDRDVDVVVKR